MSRRVGLELTGERIRAVTVSRWRGTPLESFEIRWDPHAPADAVGVLRQHLGVSAGIGISVGLEFLHVKHLKLPPVSTAERRSILMLEPDRFFPIDDGDVVVSTGDASDLVFAADAAMVESWTAAFERWAPVESIEAAPVSLARALKKGRVRDGTFRLPTATAEHGIVELDGGLLRSARRVAGGAASNGESPPPAVKGVKSEFATAFGAALGSDGSPDEMLVSAPVLSRIKRRRVSAVARGSLNLVLALAFSVAALDRSRARLLDSAEREIAAVTPRAAAGASLQNRLAAMDIELAAAQNATGPRVNPVSVLAALSQRLPLGATVMSVRADGENWQIDGTARDAGSIIPALAADARFDNIRFLSATSRFREGGRTYETFSIALRAIP